MHPSSLGANVFQKCAAKLGKRWASSITKFNVLQKCQQCHYAETLSFLYWTWIRALCHCLVSSSKGPDCCSWICSETCTACVYVLEDGTSITIRTLLSMNNIPSLSNRRLLLCLRFLFNIVKGVYLLQQNGPIEIRNYHHYSRSHSLTLKVPYAKTNALYYSFFCDTLCHWNALPHDIIDSSDAEHLKSKLFIHFRNVL